MAKTKINSTDYTTWVTLVNPVKEEIEEFKNELEECKNQVKKVEKLSKTNSWKNSKKK